MSWATRATLLTAVVLQASCAGEEADTAFDLELTPDPDLATAAQMAERIDTILMVVDSPDGLYLPSDAQVVGNVQIKNVDADVWFELVVTVPVPPGRLPWIRLRRGGLPDNPLDIRVSGLRTTGGSADVVALGRIQGLHFTPGSTQSVAVPFNIRSELLPPRVLGVSSVDDTTAAGCRVEEINVVFSRPIDEASLRATGAVLVTSDAAPDGVIVTEFRLESSGLVLIYVPANLSDPVAGQVSYQVYVGTGVRDRSGIGFDQVPADPEAQRYLGDFLLECS
jgi:hypothetical protein